MDHLPKANRLTDRVYRNLMCSPSLQQRLVDGEVATFEIENRQVFNKTKAFSIDKILNLMPVPSALKK